MLYDMNKNMTGNLNQVIFLKITEVLTLSVHNSHRVFLYVLLFLCTDLNGRKISYLRYIN